jgi:hypothetical protein
LAVIACIIQIHMLSCTSAIRFRSLMGGEKNIRLKSTLLEIYWWSYHPADCDPIYMCINPVGNTICLCTPETKKLDCHRPLSLIFLSKSETILLMKVVHTKLYIYAFVLIFQSKQQQYNRDIFSFLMLLKITNNKW